MMEIRNITLGSASVDENKTCKADAPKIHNSSVDCHDAESEQLALMAGQ